MPPVELDFRHAERVAPLEDEMRVARHGLLRTRIHRLLRRRFSDFDVNAWLGMYPMTFLSTDEWRTVLPSAGGTLLDVGAGSGDLTRRLAPLFERVVCTEASTAMARKLARSGFETHRVDLSKEPLAAKGPFDVVALLHVLDRCAWPLDLLERASSLAKPGGLVVVAVPLPYEPFVDVGRATRAPQQRLVPLEVLRDGEEVEVARRFIERRVLAERGLLVEAVARVPYLCPGDADAPFYALDSFVFVARVTR